MSLKTNIGKQFLELIDKHFPKNHVLYPIANRKNIKISYSCTRNIGALISGHNIKILNEDSNSHEETKPCNCQVKALCPVKGDCQKEQVVYKARIKESNVFYIGMTGGILNIDIINTPILLDHQLGKIVQHYHNIFGNIISGQTLNLSGALSTRRKISSLDLSSVTYVQQKKCS